MNDPFPSPILHKHLFNLIRLPFFLLSLVFPFTSIAMDLPVEDFPLDQYPQKISIYFNSDDTSYDKPLLHSSYQNDQLKEFYRHYYASTANGLSPWNPHLIKSTLPYIKEQMPKILETFNNEKVSLKDKHYGENFKRKNRLWWKTITTNVNLQAVDAATFNIHNRAISIANTFVRALPDDAPDFFHPSLPGQGFPFDNLQMSVLWAGTPLYIISTSKDKAWSLVLTPDSYYGWVKSKDMAYTSSSFIRNWQSAARHRLGAITQTNTSITTDHDQFQLTGYVGAVFPIIHQYKNHPTASILIPIKDEQHQAKIQYGYLPTKAITPMPLSASKKNIAHLLDQLKGRPYGWGGAFFYNDCSQEMKSLFTPFAIWLPRNSAQQAKLTASFDMSTVPPNERLKGLKDRGHPLMTLIYIGGHVMLYLGEKKLPADNHTKLMSYQNLWGISSLNQDKRYVIGQSVFFPIVQQYPEFPDGLSQINKSIFKLIYLDELKINTQSPQSYSQEIFGNASSPVS